jgi:diketogulonate reductase-like aldo/keto reductase
MRDLTLQNGVKIPLMALGTFRAMGDEAYTATLAAIKMGYRHIDTAMIYRNEEQVGQAIKDSGVAREELFITTKLWPSDFGYEEAKAAFALSLQKLGLEYLDLYLIHWPKSYERNAASWRALEELYQAKQIRAIGVCNFKIHHLEHLFETATIKPMVNQVECHVELQNIFLQEMCLEHGIHLQAYAPLLSKNVQDLLNNETLKTIAEKHEASIAQVALAWLMERNIIVLPKSTNEGRLLENYQSLNVQLDETDMAMIRKLNKARRTFPDPDNTDF